MTRAIAGLAGVVLMFALVGCGQRVETAPQPKPEPFTTSTQIGEVTLSLQLPGRVLESGRSYDATIIVDSQSTVPYTLIGERGRVFTLLVQGPGNREGQAYSASTDSSGGLTGLGPAPRAVEFTVLSGHPLVEHITFPVSEPGTYTISPFSPYGQPIDGLERQVKAVVRVQ